MQRSTHPSWLATLGVILLIGPALSASADEADDEALTYARPGVYLGFNITGGLTTNRTLDVLAGAGGFNARVGTRETERLAYEFELEYMVDSNVDQVVAYGLNAKFFFLEEAIQPYAVLGAGAMSRLPKTGLSRTDWAFRLGGGTDFYLTKRVALNAEITYIVGVGQVLNRDYASFSVGAIYRF